MARIEIWNKETGEKTTIIDWHMWMPCEKGERKFIFKTTLGDWQSIEIDDKKNLVEVVSWIGRQRVFCRPDGTVGLHHTNY